MKSGRTAHIVVVAAGDHAFAFVGRLRRLELGEVTIVAGLDAARRLCRGGDIDACIVAVDDTPDAVPALQGDAAGRGCGVSTLMLVTAVSPGLRKLARRAGYVAVIPATIPPRLLYCRIRAALQGRRVDGQPRRRRPGTIIALPFVLARAMPGKTTLH